MSKEYKASPLEADNYTRLLVPSGDGAGRWAERGDSGAGQGSEMAELARRLETAEQSRDRRRRSWQGLGAEELTRGSETV